MNRALFQNTFLFLKYPLAKKKDDAPRSKPTKLLFFNK